MRYRIRPALWEALMAEERSMNWLARQIGYTPQHVRRLHVAPHPVRERFAVRAAAALQRPVDELFEPVAAGGGDDGND